MEVDSSEASTVEPIDWPFLKSQRDIRDDNSSHDGDHYEIVVSNVEDVTESLHFSNNDETVGSDSNFETCLISADLAELSTADTIKLDSIADSSQNEQVEYDSVEYFPEGPTLPDDMVMTEDQQKLIKVYQAAVDTHESKMITVYEIKPDAEGDSSNINGRDVFVEIVASQEDPLMRSSLTSNGTLLLESSGNIQSTHLTIPASMVAAMGLGNNSMRNIQLSPDASSSSSASGSSAMIHAPSVSELKCTICGFASYDREEISAHCVDFHDLFFCPYCHLVFKKRQSLTSHIRFKHGTVHNSQKPKNLSAINNRSRVYKKSPIIPVMSTANTSPSIGSQSSKILHTLLASSDKQVSSNVQSHTSISPDILMQLPTHPIQPNLLATQSRELMPDIRNILSKNRAVLPSATLLFPASRQRKAGGGRGKRQYNVWSRNLDQQPLSLDSRLNDPATRNQFNIEFAKKITSTGGGVEAFGIAQDRLPSLRGTYCLEIKEMVPESGDSVTNGEIIYSYTIENLSQNTDCCKVICGQCNFSNPRIENVLFHCEIDHKQYYCQNKKCQLGFGSWESLMKHMKSVHKEDYQD